MDTKVIPHKNFLQWLVKLVMKDIFGFRNEKVYSLMLLPSKKKNQLLAKRENSRLYCEGFSYKLHEYISNM